MNSSLDSTPSLAAQIKSEGSDGEMLLSLQKNTFGFFLEQCNRENFLTLDSTQPNSPSSIAAVGMGLTSYPVAVERGYILRNEAIKRVLAVLRFFETSHQGTEENATGYKGFYYHFLDMGTGQRAWDSELSTIDTTFLIAGAIAAAAYFSENTPEEKEINRLADLLYRRVDWQWAMNRGTTLTHGWTPSLRFLPYRWEVNYNEAMLMYILALGSPTYSISPEAYLEWSRTFQIKNYYGYEYVYAAPLFIHQFSHMWIDFRGIQDEVTRKIGIDYFENSRRATFAQQAYAIENPQKIEKYGKCTWGFTASDGPGNMVLKVNGEQRVFYNYIARGAPDGIDDGTISPWGVVASLPFAPEIVIDTIRHVIERLKLRNKDFYGLEASHNFIFPNKSGKPIGWTSPWRFGINQGPIVVMIENYFSELIWTNFKKCKYMSEGLKKAGFKGGWLDRLQ